MRAGGAGSTSGKEYGCVDSLRHRGTNVSSEFSSVRKESARTLKAPRSQDALEDRLGTDRLIALSGIQVRDPFIVDRRPTHPSVRPVRPSRPSVPPGAASPTQHPPSVL